MSRLPQYKYEFPLNPQQNYYMDEHEGFAADYSDSDCLPDSSGQNMQTMPAPPHLSDIYGRHSTVVPVKVVPLNKATKMISKQQSEQFIQESYYDDRNLINSSAAPATRPFYRNGYEFSLNGYPMSIASQHDASYGTKAFRSAYHNVEQFEQFNCQNCQMVHPKVMNGKRFPVTVRTPKYYKKQAGGVVKRPSALCLAVASQPDPAVMRRPKRTLFHEKVYGLQQTQGIDPPPDAPSRTMIKHTCELELPHRVDSQGDVNTSVKTVRLPPFDEMMKQIEKDHLGSKNEVKADVIKLTKLFKPRIPATVKVRQEKAKAKAMVTNNKVRLEKTDNQKEKQQSSDATEASPGSLEKLLNQLKKCELAAVNRDEKIVEEEKKREKIQLDKNGKKKNSGERSDVTDDEKFDLSSFNYQDISHHLFKSQYDFKENSESTASIQDLTKKLTATVSRPQQQQQQSLIKPLDDHCALELHKSKSYIVNLIDRALSKELGTVPGDRHRREFETMNPKKVIETVSRHLGKSERDISVEITSALTDSLISNATSPDLNEETEEKSSKGKLCYCNSEEPMYMKQLKQLRWGHLKHIQREVKRLEDLERFLDSCSITTIPEI